MKPNTILNGDALQHLKELLDRSINMCMTSPPYWALRDYGVEGQLGLEPTFDEYINKLCDIFDEVKRVLRDDGTCWVNLGDTYGGSGVKGEGAAKNSLIKAHRDGHSNMGNQIKGYDKCLLLIPMRFAIEMVNRGWILRNTIIWYKNNCMPSSAKDRFTVDFEYLFFFSKKKNYYFETQYESFRSNDYDKERMKGPRKEYEGKWSGRNDHENYGSNDHENYGSPRARTQRNAIPNTQRAFVAGNKEGRNKRTVWDINSQPFGESVCLVCGHFDKPKGKQEKEGYFGGENKSERICKSCRSPLTTSHFAIYPEELCETPIRSGCPEFVCIKCGKPREKIMKPSEEYKKYLSPDKIEINKSSLGEYLNKARKTLNISLKEISKLFPSETGGLTGCVWNWEKGENIPTKEQWQKLKNILKLNNKFDEILKSYWEQEAFFKTSGDLKKGYQKYKNTTPSLQADYQFKEYSDCGCKAEFTSGIVLDPFFGAGTTGLVALKQNKKFIGIELNKVYIKIANARLKPYLEQRKLI